ncbi:MAG: methyltransferase domain-containing protein [Victivallales bacterium]|nr:methyltransferase domain-containing protein [Victivallales bacterium]
MEFRRIFDTIPEKFDKYRVRYSQELFSQFIEMAHITADSTVLELGPGTGQATDPILNTGCDYNAIEIGDNFCGVLQRKYGSCKNFTLIHDDFITHDFGGQRFDVIYSAATIQWIPEDVAFSKTFALLKPGGMLVMMKLQGDYKTPNEALYRRIQQVYDTWYKPDIPYACKFTYENALNYGYVDFRRQDFHGRRVLTTDDYINYCGTHSDHLTIPEPYKTNFFTALRKTVDEFGGTVVFNDTYVLMTVRRPL